MILLYIVVNIMMVILINLVMILVFDFVLITVVIIVITNAQYSLFLVMLFNAIANHC